MTDNTSLSSPLEREKTLHSNYSFSNKKVTFPISPLKRGRGCVTSAHCLPNQKQPHKADKKLLNLTRTSHRNTPLYPLPRGETYTLNYSLSNRKQHPSLPSREGLGVCHACAKLLKSKTATQSRQKTPQPNRTSHHNTPLNPLPRGELSPLKQLIIKEKSVSKSPLLRGAGGVSRPRTASQIKNSHTKPTKNSST